MRRLVTPAARRMLILLCVPQVGLFKKMKQFTKCQRRSCMHCGMCVWHWLSIVCTQNVLVVLVVLNVCEYCAVSPTRHFSA